MRTLFTLILAAILLTPLQAQVSPGDKFLGGRLSFSFSDQSSDLTNRDRSSFNFSFRPRMGFLIKDNLALGIGGLFSYNKQPDVFFFSNNNPNTPIVLSGTEFTQYSIGPFLRHYTPFSESAGLVVDLSTEVGGGKINEDTNSGSEIVNRLFNIDVGILPSFYYFFSPHFCLEASIGGLSYRYTRTTADNNVFGGDSISKSSNLDLTLASQLGISFNYYFLKK